MPFLYRFIFNQNKKDLGLCKETKYRKTQRNIVSMKFNFIDWVLETVTLIGASIFYNRWKTNPESKIIKFVIVPDGFIFFTCWSTRVVHPLCISWLLRITGKGLKIIMRWISYFWLMVIHIRSIIAYFLQDQIRKFKKVKKNKVGP